MKPFDINDPKWTAYVLNELGENERAEVEKILAENPEARAFVDEIRAAASMVSESFASEPELSLDEGKRETILASAAKEKTGGLVPFRSWSWASFAAAAAALIVAVVGIQTYHRDAQQGETDIEIAERQEQAGEESVAVLLASDEDTKVPTAVDQAMPLDAGEQADAADLVVAAPAQAEPRRSVNKPASKSSRFMRQAQAPEFAMASRGFSAGLAMEAPPPPAQWGPSLDDYNTITDNRFLRVTDHPLSTFSIDVDTASYAQIRKSLLEGYMPMKDAVRIEEMINYFPYDYAVPVDEHPFAADMEVAVCPWNTQNKLIRIALKGKEIDAANRPPLNLVFLLDVSGSMESPNKLPLLKRSLKVLVNQLSSRDRVAMVVYAGAAGLVLPPTAGDNPQAILEAVERLSAGGSTAGGAGIELAYKTAQENFDGESVNRVILCTDGDFNVGMTQQGDLVRMIEEQAKSGVYLNVLGFGMGNYKDGTLEELSNKGNGNYAYIDDFSEARKVLVDEMTGTLVTIAKDVKIQVEFNPAHVAGYRLIGYENRLLNKEDFNDDKVDAGEIGAGHTVTAFYEIVPAGRDVNDVPPVDELKYKREESVTRETDELLTLKLRYKQPRGDVSTKLEFPLVKDDSINSKPSDDFRFAAAVAAFGQILRASEFIGSFSYEDVIALAENSIGTDRYGYRAEFLKLVRNAKAIEK